MEVSSKMSVYKARSFLQQVLVPAVKTESVHTSVRVEVESIDLFEMSSPLYNLLKASLAN